MDTAIAIRTLDALAQGRDPVTAKSLPDSSPYNQPVVLRSLFIALKALESQPADPAIPVASSGRPDKPLRLPPANAGKPWTTEEDQQLCDAFEKGVAVKEIAVRHSRSTTALNARLFKLGKIADPGMPLRGRG